MVCKAAVAAPETVTAPATAWCHGHSCVGGGGCISGQLWLDVTEGQTYLDQGVITIL
jgi:hypothetical protein